MHKHKGAKSKPRKRSGPRSKTSEYLGVTKYSRTGKWQAAFWVNSQEAGKKGKQVHLGSFPDAESAARAYDRAAWRMRGPKADLNFAGEDYEEDPFVKRYGHLAEPAYVLKLRSWAQAQSRREERDTLELDAEQCEALHAGRTLRGSGGPLLLPSATDPPSPWPRVRRSKRTPRCAEPLTPPEGVTPEEAALYEPAPASDREVTPPPPVRGSSPPAPKDLKEAQASLGDILGPLPPWPAACSPTAFGPSLSAPASPSSIPIPNLPAYSPRRGFVPFAAASGALVSPTGSQGTTDSVQTAALPSDSLLHKVLPAIQANGAKRAAPDALEQAKRARLGAEAPQAGWLSDEQIDRLAEFYSARHGQGSHPDPAPPSQDLLVEEEMPHGFYTPPLLGSPSDT